MNDIAIRCTAVSKRFKIYDDMITGPMKEALFFWRKGWDRAQHFREITAVDGIDLEIEKGEVVGIVGPNGAGKTTLLKMIAGLLETDSGTIEVQGRVSAQLAQGVGIQPEFTGRENIYHSGVLLGMTDEEIIAHTPEIVDFAELGEYIDLPYRTYSSGMQARLLFSIAMSFTPDIMIIDEGLAAGDAYFVHKCVERIKEICRSGTTILLVSHSLSLIEALCQRCILLDNGRVVFDGDSRACLDLYIDDIHARASSAAARTQVQFRRRKAVLGTGDISITDAYFVVQGEKTNTLIISQTCELHIEFHAHCEIEDATIGLEVFSSKSPTTYAFPSLQGISEKDSGKKCFDLTSGAKKIILRFDKIHIGDGDYRGSITFFSGKPEYKFTYETTFCHCVNFFTFHAIHSAKKIFGRGTLCEIPVDSYEVLDR